MSTALVPSKRPHYQNVTEQNVKGKWQKTAGVDAPNHSSKASPGSVVFRVLCPVSKIHGIIGEGGAFILQIRQETGVKVRVEEMIAGCDERIVVVANSDKETDVNNEQSKEEDGDKEANVAAEGSDNRDHGEVDEEKKKSSVEDSKTMQEVSSLQKALLLVFERMAEAEPETDGGEEGNNEHSTLVLRLLVLSNQVGCLLGKGGSVVKQMSAESGAQIRILPRDKLPTCASSSDELVQITGEVDTVRKALQSVAQQLLDSLPRDNDTFPADSKGASSHSFSLPFSGPETYSRPLHSSTARGATQSAGPRGSHGSGIPGRMEASPEMLTFRLLCHNERVGGVIGKGGSIIKTLQLETGCEIKVKEGVSDSADRIILISGPAHPDDRISAAQDAVLRVQSRIARAIPNGKDKTVMARLLIFVNQTGCLLGKAGSIMAEMRKVSGAYIRILGKDQVPKFASEGEEVIQINGEFEAVQEALFQITNRLRHHFFRDKYPSMDRPLNPAFLDQASPFPQYVGRRERSPPFPSFRNFDGMAGPPPHISFHPHDDRSPFMHDIQRPGRPPHISERRPWDPEGLIESGAPMGMADFAGPPQRRFPGFGGVSQPAIITSTTVEVIVPRPLVPIIHGEDGACLKQIRQISDAKITITEPKPGATETVIIISGTPEQTNAAQSLIQAFVMSEKEND